MWASVSHNLVSCLLALTQLTSMVTTNVTCDTFLVVSYVGELSHQKSFNLISEFSYKTEERKLLSVMWMTCDKNEENVEKNVVSRVIWDWGWLTMWQVTRGIITVKQRVAHLSVNQIWATVKIYPKMMTTHLIFLFTLLMGKLFQIFCECLKEGSPNIKDRF